MALGPSSWPLIDLIMNTPNMGRSDVGKPPKAELGQVRSSRGIVLTSPQGAVRSVQCMVALGLTGFVSQTHAWLLRCHPLPAGILLDLEEHQGQQSNPQYHSCLHAMQEVTVLMGLRFPESLRHDI